MTRIFGAFGSTFLTLVLLSSCDRGPIPDTTGSSPAGGLRAVQCAFSPTGRGGDMCTVSAGSFKMGCNSVTDDICSAEGDFLHEKPYHEVTLATYAIDQHEATVAEYQACLDAGACGVSENQSHFSCTPERANIGHEDRNNLPMNCLTWEQAATYCVWAGKRLPTEAEWEKAARGTDGRAFPWGSGHTNCKHAVVENACGLSKTARVCSKPKGNSPYGVCDMIGNVEEWVNDRFDGTYYRYSPKVSPTGPEEGSERVLRGGSWRYDGINYLRASTRQHEPPDTARDNIGFRCALTLK